MNHSTKGPGQPHPDQDAPRNPLTGGEVNRDVGQPRADSLAQTTDRDVPAQDRDANRDPLSGAPGAHPVGVGVGGLAGGAAAGAAAGTVFGPLGTLIGAAVGVLAGAAVGKGVAERLDPTGEDAYWRNEYPKRSYARSDHDYDRDVAAAYAYGRESRERHGERGFDQAEADLRQDWDTARGSSQLAWEDARPAVRDAWERTDRTHRTYHEADQSFAHRYESAPYRAPGTTFEDFRPAYRHGVRARIQHGDRAWDEGLENELRQSWETDELHASGGPRMDWESARVGVREAYESEYNASAPPNQRFRVR